MAAVIANMCPECGNMHDFYLRDSDSIDGNAVYLFECPNHRIAGKISFPGDDGEVAHFRPDGGVALTPIGDV